MSLSLEYYAQAKRLPVAFLRGLGVSEKANERGTYVRIPYLNQHGAEAAVRHRHALSGPQRFTWRSGAKPQPYGQERLDQARAQGFIVLVEGESDAQTLWLHDIPALGLPGTMWNEERDAALLDGIASINIVREPDRGGDAVMAWLARSRIRERTRIVSLAPHKDTSALYLSGEEKDFARAFRTALSRGQSWNEFEESARAAAAQAALGEAEWLARSSDILGQLENSLAGRGVVGEMRNARVIFLALTSRLLDRPVSLAIKGPSSGGKSFVLDRVLEHFPSEAFLRMTGMSERALIYDERDFAHRHLVIAEAAGAEGEMQSYLIRTLLSEGRLVWQTVEKTAEGLSPRTLEKAGPTGLIVTTTKLSLHPENETRLLSLGADDTAEQTRQVMLAVAEADEQEPVEDAWRALQIWLALGERRVVVPYARKLARLASASAVRMRRDFGTVLSLIRAHALTHQLNRGRDARGRIVAELNDYGAVRVLVGDLMAEGLQQSVSPALRRTVEAVAALAGETGASVKAVAQHLCIDKSAASRRCAAAARAGYLVNERTYQNQPARYRPAETMPDDCPILPTVEALRETGAEGGGAIPPGFDVNRATGGKNGGNPMVPGCRPVDIPAPGDHSPPAAPPGGARKTWVLPL